MRPIVVIRSYKIWSQLAISIKPQQINPAAVDIHGQLVDAYEGKSEDYRYPSYFDAVINEAVNEYGLTEEDIIKNGYRIYTEMDQNYQASMQVIYDNVDLFLLLKMARGQNLVV